MRSTGKGSPVGTLYVVATPIGNLDDMTPRAIEVLRSVSLIAAEDTRHSGRLRQVFKFTSPMVSYHQHNRATRGPELLTALESGDVAVISDAGTPGIADPGHELVVLALDAGHRVVPIPGASALLAAVAGSGLVPGPFVFLGFIERAGEARRVALGKALASEYAIVIFESPLRTAATLEELSGMAGGRRAVVAREITKLHEEFMRGTVTELASRTAADPPRGEVVLVIEGAAGTEQRGEPDVEAVAKHILANGVKPSQAARELAAITGIDGAAAYEIVRSLKSRS